MYHKYYQNHSTYFSMGNYRVKAKLMICDDDDDNDGDDVSLACLEHANGFGNCALQTFNNKRVALLCGRHLAPPLACPPR